MKRWTQTESPQLTRAQKTWIRLGAFAFGALLLSVFSVFQKIAVGEEQMIFIPRAYMVPALYGGMTGLLLGEWYLRLKQNALLLQSSERRILQAYDSTLEGWAMAIELRDKITDDHSRRVVQLAEKLAQVLKLPAAEIVEIRRGAMLHDVGKISIPDAILGKPGPLTEEERTIMRRHPVHAYEMLSHIEFLRPALDIPYCHHECWDGSGYPRGLKGEEIPLSARIFAVVDVWDALTSDRPYRKAWTRERALEYLQSLSGAQFDPDILQAFVASKIYA